MASEAPVTVALLLGDAPPPSTPAPRQPLLPSERRATLSESNGTPSYSKRSAPRLRAQATAPKAAVRWATGPGGGTSTRWARTSPEY